MSVLAAASFHPAELLGFSTFPVLYWSCPCSCSFTSVCVCVCYYCVSSLSIDSIVIQFFKILSIVFGSTSQGVGSHKECFRPRPETLCSRRGRPWSSQTLKRWTSAPKCSCTACCGRGPSDGRRPSGPAGEAEADAQNKVEDQLLVTLLSFGRLIFPPVGPNWWLMSIKNEFLSLETQFIWFSASLPDWSVYLV